VEIKSGVNFGVHAAFYLEDAFVFFFFAFLGRDLPKVPR